MEITSVFGDAGTSVIGSLFKNNRLKWLPGWIFITSLVCCICCFLSQASLFPDARVAKVAKGFVDYIQSYIPFIRNYYVPPINFLIKSFFILIFVFHFLIFLMYKLSLPLVNLANLVKRYEEVLLILIIPNCMLYVSFMLFAPVADINQFLAHFNLLWLLLILPAKAFTQVNHFWLLFILPYLCFFLSHMFNSIYSWAISIDSNKAVIDATPALVGISSALGNAEVDATDRGTANRYINERSISINSMRDQFAHTLNVGQAYLSVVASREGYESIDQWIEKHARDAAIKETQSIKRENCDPGSSHE